MQFDFEWDPVKTKSNFQKYKVSFERAIEIFLDSFMLSIFDKTHSGTEDRWVTVGKDRNNVTIVVVHTFKEIDPKIPELELYLLEKLQRMKINNITKGKR